MDNHIKKLEALIGIHVPALSQVKSNTNLGYFLKRGKILALYLKNLNLREIPFPIFDIESLECLFLDHNPIEILPSKISKLRSLEILSLNSTKIQDLPPEIGELVNLKKLNISRTLLTDLPKEISQLHMLEEIWWVDHRLNHFPTYFPHKNLRYLYLGKYIKNRINTEGRDGFLKEEKFKLPQHLSNLENLLVLDLTGNYLGDIPIELSKLPSLSVLDLNNCGIKHLENIGEFSNIESLSLNDNLLLKIPSSISKLSKLSDFWVNNNLLFSLPPSLINCPLEEGIMADNNFLYKIPSTFLQRFLTEGFYYNEGNPSLNPWGNFEEILNDLIPHNFPNGSIRRLVAEDPEKFQVWIQKERCQFHPSEIQEKLNLLYREYCNPPEHFLNWFGLFVEPSQIPFLTDFRENLPAWFHSILAPPQQEIILRMVIRIQAGYVIEIDCYNQQLWLRKIPESIRDVVKLERLKIHKTEQYQSQLLGFIQNLHDLKFLWLPNCQIEDIPNSFKKLKKLHYLNLVHNKLTQIPSFLFELPHLEYIFLTRNQIRTLPQSFSTSTKNLQITQNPIIQITPNQTELRLIFRLSFQEMFDLLCDNPLEQKVDMYIKRLWIENPSAFADLTNKKISTTPPGSLHTFLQGLLEKLTIALENGTELLL